MSAADQLFLNAAIELAENGRFTTAPNPCVGCVVVRDGKITGRGYHMRVGEPHAEINAMTDAGDDVAGATVYVSLEPCAFEDRTPACAKTLIEAGVGRVVYAAIDPHPKVSGAGDQMLREAGVEVQHIDSPAAGKAIAGFARRVTTGRPLVRLKTASSLDGSIALANGESQWITGSAARSDVQYWRARSDAIVTGVGTVLADNPQLTVRDAAFDHAHEPLRVVLDSRLRTPATSQIATDSHPTLIIHNRSAAVPKELGSTGVELMAVEDTRNLELILDELGSRGCNEILVEAGPGLVGSFVQDELWDEWLMYVASRWLGSDSRSLANFSLTQLKDAPEGKLTAIARIGDDLRLMIEREQ